MTIGCWRFAGTSTQNCVVTVGDNETTPLRPDTLLGEFDSPISDITGIYVGKRETVAPTGEWRIHEGERESNK